MAATDDIAMSRIGPKWSISKSNLEIGPILDTVKSTVGATGIEKKSVYKVRNKLESFILFLFLSCTVDNLEYGSIFWRKILRTDPDRSESSLGSDRESGVYEELIKI